MTSLERLQLWFTNQCDGDWEHGAGIVISTLDNPGWSVDIEVRGTPLEGQPFVPVKVERAEQDWLHASSAEGMFKVRCGPMNLEEALTLFCDWAEST